MLSPESKQIYDILRSLTGDDDVYKIIEADEVLEKLPQDIQFTKVQLSATIKDLKERDYINVKYFTPDEYCLLTLKRIEEAPVQPVFEAEAVTAVEEDSKKERILYGTNEPKAVKSVNPGLIFLMAFLGALIGSGIVAVIVAILAKTVF